MADNVAQSIKDLQKDLAALDKQLLSNNANWDKLGQTIVDSMKRGGLGLDDLFSKMKGQKDVLKLRAIIDRDALMEDVKKLQTAVDKGVKRVKVGGVEIIGQKQIEQALEGYKAQLKLVPKTLAEAYDYAVKIANTLGSGKQGQQSAISKQRVKDEKDVQKIQEQTTAALQKRIELEERLNTLKPNGKAWRDVKKELEQTNKEVQNYLAQMGSFGTAGARQLKAYEKAGLLTATDKAQLDAEKKRIELIREKNRLEEQSARLRQNLATRELSNTATIPYTQRTSDQIAQNDKRLLEIERQIANEKIQLTQTTNERIAQMELAHQNNLTNIRNQGEQARRNIREQELERSVISGNKREEQIERERRENRIREAKQAFKEESRILQDAAQSRTEDEKRSTEMINREQAKRKEALQAQQKNFLELNRLLIARRKLQAQIDNQPQGATKNQENSMRRLNIEIDRTVQSMRELDKQYRGITARASQNTMAQRVFQTNSAVLQLERSLNNVSGNISRLMMSVSRLASAFGVAFSVQGLVNFGKKLVETRGQFEMQFVAMKQIIQDTDAATKIWNQTMQQALQSPFRALQLVDYTKKLAAYRIENEKLFDTTKRLADVSAGLGVDMGRLILAYGQVKTANFLRASEVRQFTEAGVNIYGELAKYFSEIEGRAVSTADVVERVSKRMVMFSDVEEIFKRMTDEGGTFFNMQEVQANTVRGQIMKLHDAYDQMLNTIGEKNQGRIKNIVDTLNNLVRNWRDVAAAMKLNLAILIPIVSWFKVLKPIITASTFAFSGGTKAIMGFNTQLKVGSTNLKVWSRAMKMSIAASSGFGKVLKTIILRTRQFGAAFSAFGKLPQFALLTAALWATEKIILKITGGIGNLDRAVRNLHKDLENLSSTEVGNYKTESDGYKDLVNRLSDANEGSEERRQIISKLNSQYGQYLDFIVDETTKTEDLANAYETVTKRMKESAKSKVLEQGYEKIQKTYYDLREEAKKELSSVGVAGSQFLGALGFTTKIQKKEIDDLAGYIESKLGDLSEQEIENLDKEMFARKSIAEFMGIEDETRVMDANKAVSLIDVYIKQQHEILDLEKQINGQLESSNRTRAQINAYRKLENDYAKELKDIESGNYSENEVKYLKEKAALRYEENKIQLRVELGEISDTEAEELRKNLQNKLINIAQEVNNRLKVYVARQFNFAKDFDDYIEENIGKNLPEIDAAIQLYNRLRTNESDIAQGISKYEQAISGDIERQLQAIREILKQKQLGYAVDEEDLNKQILLLENLEKQASLWGIKPKELSSNWINAQTYADIQSKFSEKYHGPTSVTFRGLTAEDMTYTQVELAEKYNKLADEQKKIVDALNKSKAEGVTIDALALAQATANEEAYRDLAKWLGYVKSKTSGTGGQKESVSAMISLIKEMNSEYGKLSKSAYGFAQSQDKVTDSFRKSFEQIFRVRGGQGTYIKYDDIDFTNKAGAAKALQAVFDQINNANAWGKFAKNAKDELLKAISGLEVEADIEVKTRIRENFGRQMEDAFSDFQLTLDLEKLNLPHSLMQTMFDIEAVDLAGMRQKLSELSKTLLDENGVMSDDNWKVYNDWLKKIEDKERDMQRQRLKDYSKYLEYQLSERAKLEMEYARKVAEVQSEPAFDDNTRARILRGLQEEYDKKIAKQDWEDFKGSEMYVEMMEDLTRQGTASLEEMRKKLVEVRDNSENLSPRALKEVVNALQKIDEVVDSRVSPFARIKDLGKDLKDAMKESGFDNMRDVFAADEDAKRRYKELKDEYDEIQAVIGAKQQEKEIEEQLGDYRNSSIASLQDLINKKKEEKKSEDEAISSLGERDKSNQQEIESRTQVSNALQGEIDKYESIIKLLKQLEEAQKTIRGSSKYGNTDLGLLSVDSDTHKEQMDAAESTTKRLGIITRLWQRLRKATQESLEATKEYLNSTKDLIDSSYTLLQNFGAKTDEVSDQWKQFVDTYLDSIIQGIDAFKKFAEAQDNAIKGITKGLATGDYITLILSLLSAIVKVYSQLGLFRGARIDKEIREQQEYIDKLSMAYDRLEKAIAKTVTTSDYLNTYNKQIQNTYQQIAATRAQLAAAQSRKNVDQSEVDGYRSALYELNDQLEDLQNQMQETFGGIGGRGNYRSWAEEFVSEWRSAFLETGDGLDALEDHFNEFLQSWFEKQATMRIAAKMLDPLMSMIDQSVDDGILTRMELDRIKERASEIFPQLNEQLQEFYETMGFGDAYGSLSGLAQAISGMTEEQADILAAYWNSVRMHTASIDINVAAIANALGVGAGSPESNPMLQQIRIVARNTESINSLFESVVKTGHPQGGNGLKVFMN